MNPFAPSEFVKLRIEMPPVATVMHPFYSQIRVDYLLPGGCYCPLLGRDAQGFRLPLEHGYICGDRPVEVF